MKKLFTLLCAIMISGSFVVQAQSYYYVQSTGTDAAYDYATVGSQALLEPANEVLSATQTIPFSWNFYGSPVTQYKVSDNGYITFDVNATTSVAANTSIPSGSNPNGAIYAWWTDVDLQATGQGSPDAVNTWTYGPSGNRVHVIQWFSVTPGGTTSSGSNFFYFAIRIYEAGGFDIVHSGGAPALPMAATVGVEDFTGSDANMVTGSPSIAYPTLNYQDPADNIVYTFTYGSQPKYDLSVTSVDMNAVVGLGDAPFTIGGTINNLGSETITSFKINYSVNGGTVETGTISGVSIASGSSYAFSHSSTWTPVVGGDYDIKVWATALNGVADLNMDNDAMTVAVTVAEKVAARVPLYEDFMGSTCPPCAPANAQMLALFGKDHKAGPNPNKWSVVKYPMTWPGNGDPYNTSEGTARRTYYSVNSIPRLEVDGGWDENGNNLTQAIVDQFAGVVSFVDINAWVDVNAQAQTVTVNAVALPHVNINSSGVVWHIAIVENTTTQNAITVPNQSNGETEFHWVMKKMLPNASGTAAGVLQKGTSKAISQGFTFPGTYTKPNNALNPINIATEHHVEDFNDLAVVVWLQDVTTKEVFQSAWAEPLANAPNYDLSIVSISNESVVALADAPFQFTGTIMNMGLQSITDFDLHYSINGAAAVTVPVTGQNIAFLGGSATYTHTTDWTPAAAGQYTVEVWADNINSGNSDENTSNDKDSKIINVVGASLDLAAVSVLINPIVDLTDAPFEIEVGFENKGGAAISSMDIHYQINSETPVDEPISNANIDPLMSRSFKMSIPWTPTATGNYTIKVWADDLNSGQTDENTANDIYTTDVIVNSTVGVNDAAINTNNGLVSVYPNPASDVTAITYAVDATSDVRIEVYDLTGTLLSVDDLGTQASGTHVQQLAVGAYTDGLYIVNVVINDNVFAKKMVVSK